MSQNVFAQSAPMPTETKAEILNEVSPCAGVLDVWQTYKTYQGKSVFWRGTKSSGGKIYYLEGYLKHYKTDLKGFHYYGTRLKVTKVCRPGRGCDLARSTSANLEK